MSINFNPGPKIQNLLDQDQWWTIANYVGLTQVVTGSGSSSKLFPVLSAITGSTASSTALARSSENTTLSRGKAVQVINWSKKVILRLPVVSINNTANGVSRFTLGKDTANGVGDLDEKGVGIQIDQLALKGIVHNGSAGATVDFSLIMTTNQVYLVEIVSDGAGNVEWFVDGVSKGDSSGGPTGDATAGNSIFQLEVDNGGDAAGQTIRIGPLQIYVEQ